MAAGHLLLVRSGSLLYDVQTTLAVTRPAARCLVRRAASSSAGSASAASSTTSTPAAADLIDDRGVGPSRRRSTLMTSQSSRLSQTQSQRYALPWRRTDAEQRKGNVEAESLLGATPFASSMPVDEFDVDVDQFVVSDEFDVTASEGFHDDLQDVDVKEHDVQQSIQTPRKRRSKALHSTTIAEEGDVAEPLFGRGLHRKLASKAVLSANLSQQDKAQRKARLEEIAMTQGVLAAQQETKRLRREDARRRQARKAHLLRIQPYLERNYRLIQMEAEEDRKEIAEQQTWSDAKLQQEGIMLRQLEGYWLQHGASIGLEEGTGGGGGAGASSIAGNNNRASKLASSAGYLRTAVLHRRAKAKLGWTRIQKGDQVALRADRSSGKIAGEDDLDATTPLEPVIGTVRTISEFEVRLTFRDPPADLDLLSSPVWRIDIAYNETIEARLQNSVDALTHDVEATRKHGAELSGTYLVDVLHDKGRMVGASNERQAPIAEWIRTHRHDRPAPDLTHLTTSQRDAVQLMLEQRVSLIQGPPGTGKTSTIVETIKILKKHYEIPHPILLTSHTNVAVDNLAQGCKEAGLHVVRAGPSGRVREAIMDITLEGRMDRHPYKKRLEEVESIRAATMQSLQSSQRGGNSVETQAQLQRPVDVVEDNFTRMSFSDIAESDSTTPSQSRSKPTLTISQLQKRLSQMNQRAFMLRREMEIDIFAEADVVCCTALSVPLIRATDFPLVFFDEATMATEPITISTIVKGCQQLSLIGDHKQLSPLIRSREAMQEQLGESMFERLMARGDVKSVMLDTQHRMHPSLAAFSAAEFYGGRLLNGTKTEEMKALNSTFVPLQRQQRAENGESAGFLTFVHHDGREHLAKSKSLENYAEAELVMGIVADLFVQNNDLHGKDVAILVPYAGQRELIARSLPDPQSALRRFFARQLEKRGGAKAKARIRELSKIEVETVDGFEGREKRVVVFSMVRNNVGRFWGFLNEHKRWNVALTRARNGLWIVGSMPMMERKSMREMMLSSSERDADAVEGVKGAPTWRPESGEHAGFITRFAQHLRANSCVLDAKNVPML